MRHLGCLILALVIVGLGVSRSPAIETATFGAEPSPRVAEGKERQAFHYRLRRRETVEDGIRIFNKTRGRVVLTLYGVDARRQSNGSVSIGLQRGGIQVGSWIHLEDNDLSLDPRSEEVVRFSLRAPGSFPAGKKEYIGAIAIEPVPDPSQPGVAVVQRLAVAVYVEPRAGLADIVANPLAWAAFALLIAVVALFVRRLERRPR